MYRNKRFIIIAGLLILALLAGCGKDDAFPENAPPVFQAIDDASVYPGDMFSLQVIVSDPEEDTLTVRLIEFPAGALFDGQQVSWSPGMDDIGVHNFRLEASDGENVVFQSFHISVLEPEVSDIVFTGNSVTITTADACEAVLEYGPDAESYNYFAFDRQESTENHSFKIFNYTPGVEYSFRIKCIYANGEEEYYTDEDGVFELSNAYSGELMKAAFVDVEQGDGNLIRFPGGNRWVVDGGFGTYQPDWSEAWTGGGEPRMLDFLLDNNINYVQNLIETHHDMDHWGGLYDIYYSPQVNYGYYISPDNGEQGSFVAGNSFSEGDVDIYVLNSGIPSGFSGDYSDNNKSIAFQARFNDVAFLYTGDIEWEIEEHILETYAAENIRANVLKAAHHGSHTSSSASFLDAVFEGVYPRIIIASFGVDEEGTDDDYGHPHNVYRFSGNRFYGTNKIFGEYDFVFDNCGNIVLYTDGYYINLKTNSAVF